jgi:hypothetical protein
MGLAEAARVWGGKKTCKINRMIQDVTTQKGRIQPRKCLKRTH